MPNCHLPASAVWCHAMSLRLTDPPRMPPLPAALPLWCLSSLWASNRGLHASGPRPWAAPGQPFSASPATRAAARRRRCAAWPPCGGCWPRPARTASLATWASWSRPQIIREHGGGVRSVQMGASAVPCCSTAGAGHAWMCGVAHHLAGWRGTLAPPSPRVTAACSQAALSCSTPAPRCCSVSCVALTATSAQSPVSNFLTLSTDPAP